MEHETNSEKIPIRGWLILVAITLWTTAIGSVLVLIASFSVKLSWVESLLTAVTALLSITTLVLFVRRRSKFVLWFLALLTWALVSSVVLTSMSDTTVSSFLYTVIGNILLSLYVLRSERVRRTFGVGFSDRFIKTTWFIIGGLILVSIAWAIFCTYPRHIDLKLKGVEYKLGAPKQGVKTVTMQLNGTLQRALWGKRTFNGTINIKGSTPVNKDNGKTLQITFNSELGGEIIYYNWKTMTFYDYGQLYANKAFNTFTITVYTKEGKGFGWNGGNGLMITVPAKTRSQALEISNELMKSRLLPRHSLSGNVRHSQH